MASVKSMAVVFTAFNYLNSSVKSMAAVFTAFNQV